MSLSLYLVICLVLLFVVSLRIDFGELFSDGKVSDERRGPPPNPVELAVSKNYSSRLLDTNLIVDYGLCRWIYLG